MDEARLAARRKYNREYGAARTVYWKAAVFAALGNKCVDCGFSDIRALQVDHVNSDGYLERVKTGSGSYYKRVVKDATSGRYQILCANCNWIKRHTHNETDRLKRPE